MVVYVDGNRDSGSQDGKSWDTAFRSVQDGIDAAAAGGGGEVWVAAATYTPTNGSDRTLSIRLKPGVELYGGFVGNEAKRTERDLPESLFRIAGDIKRHPVKALGPQIRQ